MEHGSIENRPRPITWGRPFRGPLVAPAAALSGLVVRFGTYQRVNRSRLRVRVTRVRTGERRTAEVASETLVDNGFVTFRFAPFASEAGESFRVELRSAAGQGSCVAAFVTPGGALEARTLHGPVVLGAEELVLPPDVMVRSREVGEGGFAYALTNWWVDRFGVYLEGTLTLAEHAPIERVQMSAAEASADLVVEPLDTPAAHRFSGYLACRPGEPIRLALDTARGRLETRVTLPRETVPHPPSPGLFLKFIDMVNRDKSSVVEVGSRPSSPFAFCNRPHFRPHVRFVGFDILPGENTDVVGDAHHLTRYFPEGSLGAVYSLTVLEHLLMPWRFAAELNRVLEMGGLIFHATHQTWPVHAAPNDFYRFSVEALRFLFGPEAGFEVIDTHMEHRFWLYPEERAGAYLHTPLFRGWGNVQVLARMGRHLGPADGAAVPDHLTDRSRQYPRYET
jgi:hypothetical protein